MINDQSNQLTSPATSPRMTEYEGMKRYKVTYISSLWEPFVVVKTSTYPMDPFMLPMGPGAMRTNLLDTKAVYKPLRSHQGEGRSKSHKVTANRSSKDSKPKNHVESLSQAWVTTHYLFRSRI
ncbi:unnamed protein product [Protopolystoma xenopodis]|uniref:Uncharacterized protein n=1 Tax=Protopolystoma xenopodis TaxID=117903 RepID=A0A3S5CGD0_9PLAT|nr:unnamed protein product [Protopolystoma xenopodis]